MTWPSSARAWSCAIGRPGSAGWSAVVSSALMSPPRPRRKREDDQQRPSQRHPPRRVEAPEIGGAARLGPEVIPASLMALGGTDLVFAIRTGSVLAIDQSIAGSRGRSLSRGKHECSPGWSGSALSEGEGVRVGAWLKEADLQRSVAYDVVLAYELVHAVVSEYAVAVRVDVHACRRAGSLAVEGYAEGDRLRCSSRKHEVGVTRVEAEGDAPAGLVENDGLGPDRPLAGKGPMAEAQALPDRVQAIAIQRRARRRPVLAAARGAEVGLGRAQVIPVGRRLHAGSFDGYELAVDAQELLDDALELLVASFAEVLVADDAVAVGEVQRRPVVVGEGAPDLVVVVDHDRVVDRSLACRAPHAVDVVLEGELGRVDADDDQPIVAVGLGPRADVGPLAQPVDARPGPEVHEHDVAP